MQVPTSTQELRKEARKIVDELDDTLHTSASGSSVDTVMVQGKIVVEDRRIMTLDMDEVAIRPNSALKNTKNHPHGKACIHNARRGESPVACDRAVTLAMKVRSTSTSTSHAIGYERSVPISCVLSIHLRSSYHVFYSTAK